MKRPLARTVRKKKVSGIRYGNQGMGITGDVACESSDAIISHVFLARLLYKSNGYAASGESPAGARISRGIYVTRTSRCWREASSPPPSPARYVSAVLPVLHIQRTRLRGAERKAARFEWEKGSSACTGCDGFHFGGGERVWTIDVPRLGMHCAGARLHLAIALRSLRRLE